MSKTSDCVRIIDNLIGDDSGMREMVEQEIIHSQVAQLIYDARVQAGLTHAELAKLAQINEKQLMDLEDANFDGPSVPMLQRVAAALNKRIDISLRPV